MENICMRNISLASGKLLACSHIVNPRAEFLCRAKHIAIINSDGAILSSMSGCELMHRAKRTALITTVETAEDK